MSESAQAATWSEDLGLDSPARTDAIARLAERARYGASEDLPPVDGQLTEARARIRAAVGTRRWWAAMALPRGWRRRER